MLNVTKKLREYVKNLGVAQDADDDVIRKSAADAIAAGKLTPDQLTELTKVDVSATIKSLAGEVANQLRGGNGIDTSRTHSAAGVFGGSRVDVLPAGQRYKSIKTVGLHSRTGKPVRDEFGREVETTSELEHAKLGAWVKFLASKTPGTRLALNEHEKSLVHEIFEKDLFCGCLNGNWLTGIEGLSVKALLNDSTSGGLELVPEWFDMNVVTFPLLHSELFPFVDLVPVPRGASVEGASVGNPSVGWSYQEGTAIGLFDTAALVAAIDSDIHPLTAAIEVGRDLMADSVAAIGKIIEQNIGQKMAAELDNVIANGDGTTQPQGIFNASGLTSVSSAGGAGADPQIDDYEALMFAIGKQYRKSQYRCCYIANDTTYSRVRGIPVGAADARRVFGMDHSAYTILDWPYRIQNDIANSKIAFGAMATYRMYRRQGQEVRWVTEDAELARKNQSLLVVRGRYGGKVVDANAWAKITDAKA